MYFSFKLNNSSIYTPPPVNSEKPVQTKLPPPSLVAALSRRNTLALSQKSSSKDGSETGGEEIERATTQLSSGQTRNTDVVKRKRRRKKRGAERDKCENSRKVWAFTSRWVSSRCSANSYEPENRPIKSPWVPPLCLQSIPFTAAEAARPDYNIAAVHA